MMQDNPFTGAELERRLAAFRAALASRQLDGAVVAAPENVFYLTGLDHWGYFAPHLLLVPAEGEMALVTRAMERVTVAHQVQNARFEGHADHETAADVALRLLRERGRSSGRIGIEKWSAGLPSGLAEALTGAVPDADWVDVTGLIDAVRMVKSPAEQACMRAAARVSDAAITAAIEAIRVGASEHARP